MRSTRKLQAITGNVLFFCFEDLFFLGQSQFLGKFHWYVRAKVFAPTEIIHYESVSHCYSFPAKAQFPPSFKVFCDLYDQTNYLFAASVTLQGKQEIHHET